MRELSYKDKAVIRLWGEGNTTSDIAAALDTTPNTVAGMIRRLRRQGHTLHNRASTNTKAVRENRKAYVKPVTRGVIAANKPDNTGGVPFLDPKSNQCRWPLWSMDYKTGGCCGSAVVSAGASYCTEHYAKAYTRYQIPGVVKKGQ